MNKGKIEEILYKGLKSIVSSDNASSNPMLSPALSGKVYYQDTRPVQNETDESVKEDIVVSVPAGNNSQLQSGSCIVNIYVPDILTASGSYMRYKSRTDMIEEWANTLPQKLNRLGDIYFTRSSMVVTLKEEAIHQHFVSLKMDFKLLNEDFD